MVAARNLSAVQAGAAHVRLGTLPSTLAVHFFPEAGFSLNAQVCQMRRRLCLDFHRMPNQL
jgi:hypothetical protein